MCTLTLVAGENGYLLAMNRDEQVARGAGMVPEQHEYEGTRVVYPTDGAGGTWIGVNECGVGMALLNWNDPAPSESLQLQSRGRLIPALIRCHSMTDLAAAAVVLDMECMRPFRMVGVFPAEQTVREWRWNSQNLEVLSHPWKSQHWFSSGLSDQQAALERNRTCANAWNEACAGTSAWLRKLHASHDGGPAFGICVHRGDVVTLSYTEIDCSPERIHLQHFLGNSCAMVPGGSAALPRESTPVASHSTLPGSLLRLGPIA
jgi:hypothetical protein